MIVHSGHNMGPTTVAISVGGKSDWLAITVHDSTISCLCLLYINHNSESNYRTQRTIPHRIDTEIMLTVFYLSEEWVTLCVCRSYMAPYHFFLCGGKSQSSDVWSLSTSLFCCYEFADDFVSQCLSNSQFNLSVEKSYSESNYRRHPLKYTRNTWAPSMCVNMWCTVLSCIWTIHSVD